MTQGPEMVDFGSWPSPISADLVAAGGVRYGDLTTRVDEEGTEIWWLESRPGEAGRGVLVSARPGQDPVDRLPAPWSARSQVHEYGGGAFWLGRANVYFVNWNDQRLYRLSLHGDADDRQRTEPVPLTAEPEIGRGLRYADGVEHPDGSAVVCVREDHTGDRDFPANEIVTVDLKAGGATVLVSGPDFVSCPRISPDGRWLSWIQWDHPNMPWDETSLCAAPLFGGTGGGAKAQASAPLRIGNTQVVASGAAIIDADWTSDGRLVFATDESGFWNLSWWTPAGSGTLTSLQHAEIGYPPWVFGLRQWAELSDGRLGVIVTSDAADALAVVDGAGVVHPVPHSDTSDPDRPEVPAGPLAVTSMAPGPDGSVVVLVASSTSLTGVASVDVDSGRWSVHRRPDQIVVGEQVRLIDWLSVPEPVWFDSGDHDTQCFFYPPTAPVGQVGKAEGLPPLVVVGHGGPTSHANPALDLKIQYWTSRGFAVADVNYGGSSGFGRAYRRRLHRGWGVVDVEDCIAAADHLAREGRVDGDRLVIRGSSAGGLTVLNALITSSRFAAGTSLYGVADLEALVHDTHKFELRYPDNMVGPYPEAIDVYRERSPIANTDGLTAPMLVMQGLEDKVVPPSQSEAIVAVLAAKGIPHAYVEFPDEQHGFRKSVNVIRSLEVELWFYGRVLGFEPADPITPPDGAVGL